MTLEQVTWHETAKMPLPECESSYRSSYGSSYYRVVYRKEEYVREELLCIP